MALAAPKTRYTPEDLLTMPDGEHYELVDGELVERDMGTEANWIAGEVYGQIREFNRAARLGWALPDTSYQCFAAHPDRVRRPDASFIRAGRMPGDRLPKGHCPIAPDLAVEVISPNDYYADVRTKVDEYLRAGVSLVWILDPGTRSVEVLRADGSAALLRADDELTGEALLPGFRCPVANLFPPA
jgi:Uma2 family endonuclease